MSGILSTLANCLPSREKPYCGGPSVRIGVLGGGQLGRMMIQDAIDLDARVEVMDPSATAWKSTSEHRVDGVEVDATIPHEGAVKFDVHAGRPTRPAPT